MLSPFCENQRGAILLQFADHVTSDPRGPIGVTRDPAQNFLDAGLVRQPGGVEAGAPLQNEPTGGALDPLGARERVTDRSALHRDDRVQTISPVWRRSETRDSSSRDALHQLLDRDRRNVVAFINDHVAVTGEVDVPTANHGLDHRQINPGRRRRTPRGTDIPRFDAEEPLQLIGPLLKQRSTVNEHQRGPCALGDQRSAHDSLACSGWRYEHTDITHRENIDCGLLRWRQRAAESRRNRLAVGTLIAHRTGNPDSRQLLIDEVQASPRKHQTDRAGTGAENRTQTCAPRPERERSTNTGTSNSPAASPNAWTSSRQP